ncbi:nardilysin-like [Linepithema humile]|uniref:nardilysin-like n=1 Tax=Linepithema humile TaxID=83485 RepID=UPI0006234677|nr:PREDICTED: nardilysin-like [Linepithema humile]
MTRGFFFIQRLIVVGSVIRPTPLLNRMLKRSAQSPPERKAKINQDSLASVKSTDRSNLKLDLSQPNIMPKTERTASDDKHRQVEYLETPVKSENDKKQYRVIKLQNGLTALLISDVESKVCSSQDDDEGSSEDETEDDESDEEDEDDDEDDDEDSEEDASDEYDEEDTSSAAKRIKRDEKKAACGLCVGVGSFSDPPEIPGMAHFLEHMVFMGSEKYPEENNFDAFVSKHGGFTNASTDCEHTTFYFDVQEKHFLSALDRFAQFFIKPLMKEDAISREREAVESEFQLALSSDENRKEQLFSSFARTDHPANKFIWGNLITLRENVADDKLYADLHKFRERHYSAHRMKLTVQARLPLDTLEKYVTDCFTDVPSNGLLPDDFTEYKDGVSFDTPAFRRMYKVKPVKDFGQLELTWVMPSLHDLYQSKPHQYISWIIGHEGRGSLISYLRKKMWAFDMYSGNSENGFEHSSMYALLKLTVLLTDEGQAHLKDVLDAIFQFINLMKKEGPQRRIYDEIYKIEENNFRFINEEDPADYVEDLCECMHFYPPRDYITGSELYFEYNEAAIQKCLDYLTPENVNIMIFDKKLSDEELDKVEPWFSTKYTDTEIPQEWIACWKKSFSSETPSSTPLFHLPLPNEFLTNDFSLIPLEENVPKYPVKIHRDNVHEIWYRPDPKFRLPECYMNFLLVSPLGFKLSENVALMALYVNVLKLLLVEELYSATTARLDYSIIACEKGIIIKLDGFNEKLPHLLMTIGKYIADYSNFDNKELFEVVKRQQLKEYYNTFIKPGKLVKDVRLSILKLVHYTNVDMHNSLRNVDFEKFKNFVKSFTDHLYIQCLVQGNITRSAVEQNVQQFVKIINCGQLLPTMKPQMKVMEMLLGSHYCKLKNINRTDVNSVVTNYYQIGVASIELTVLVDLLIMVMKEPLFTQLRSKEQLGYDVSCILRDIYGILGYSVTVHTQADKYTTDHVDKRIEEFMKSLDKILQETTEEELESLKETLRKMKQCADIDLEEEVSRNWIEITRWQYMFDRLERETLAIKNIKIDELRQFVAKYMLKGSSLRKLSVHVVGTDPKQNATDNVDEDREKTEYSLEYITDDQQHVKSLIVTDIDAYKKLLSTFPVSEEINFLDSFPNE